MSEASCETERRAGRALQPGAIMSEVNRELTFATRNNDDQRLQAAESVGLTPREREVLGLVAQGCTNREIAATLFVSHRTAATHVANILGKLDVSSRTEATAWAVREGLA
jgi:DNA-binding NarL/FixJ family response regulator